MRTVRRIDSLGLCLVLLLGTLNSVLLGSTSGEQSDAAPSLTIYNQGFAVVRQKLPLDLKSGVNHVQIMEQNYQQQASSAQSGSEQPLIEVNGKLQFSLPGQPAFPALADDTILKPTLSWELQTDKLGPTTTEFSYVTGGMDWQASYNRGSAAEGQRAGTWRMDYASQREREDLS